MAHVRLICTRETFRPSPSEGVTWWRAEDWEAARDAHVGMWPEVQWWTQEDWQRLYSEGYRYCDRLVDGRAVATAGLWARTDEEWEVIAVGTAPAHRNKGYGKVIVSSVTQAILDAGRPAVITTREDNAPMRRVAAALGYEPRTGSWVMKVADLIAELQKLDLHESSPECCVISFLQVSARERAQGTGASSRAEAPPPAAQAASSSSMRCGLALHCCRCPDQTQAPIPTIPSEIGH